ncbi:MAG: hypothetical protein AAGF11_27090 [Myxococcota bacterium]
MNLDLAGIGMLAAAALWLLSLLMLLTSFVARTERRTGGRVMLLALVLFLGTALGGTWQRINNGAPAPTPTDGDPPALAQGPIETSPTPTDPPGVGEDRSPPSDAEGHEDPATGAPSGDPTAAAEPTDAAADLPQTEIEPAADPSLEADTEPGDDAADDVGDNAADDAGDDAAAPSDSERVATAGDGPSDPDLASWVPPVKPLPDDPNRRKWAIVAILREVTAVANTPRSCARIKPVATAWARLKLVPSTPKSRGLARKLEKCRRALLYSRNQRYARARDEARDKFFKNLTVRLREQEGDLFWAHLEGKTLRIGSASLDEQRAERIMNAGLREDLVRLHFAKAVFSDSAHKKRKIYEFEITPDNQLGRGDMEAVGLGQKLELPNKP